jgi:hypothetical protein
MTSPELSQCCIGGFSSNSDGHAVEPWIRVKLTVVAVDVPTGSTALRVGRGSGSLAAGVFTRPFGDDAFWLTIPANRNTSCCSRCANPFLLAIEVRPYIYAPTTGLLSAAQVKSSGSLFCLTIPVVSCAQQAVKAY